MDTFKTLLPVLTFLLGCAFTLVLRRIQDRKALRQASIREISRLTTAWYNQIHGYPTGFNDFSHLDEESGTQQSAMYQYVYNRLILPELLVHLAVIERDRRCAELVKLLQKFLDTVTVREPLSEEKHLEAGELGERARYRAWAWRRLYGRRCLAFDRFPGGREGLLKQLDQMVQEIASESGSLAQ